MWTVYAIHNNIDGKVYVGQTKATLKRRFQAHIDNQQSLVGLDIRKFGRQFFTVVPLVQVETIEEADKEEIEAIQFFNSIHPNGYNREAGGHHAAATEAVKARMRGRFVSEETRRKIAEWHRGRKANSNQLEALRIGRTFRKPESSKGEKNGNARLSLSQVREIRDLYKQGLSQQKIGDMFGVKQVTVSAIVRGKTWPD